MLSTLLGNVVTAVASRDLLEPNFIGATIFLDFMLLVVTFEELCDDEVQIVRAD